MNTPGQGSDDGGRWELSQIIIPRIKSPDQLAWELQILHGAAWSTRTFTDEFIPGFRDCYYCTSYTGHEDDDAPATRRISVNVWGTIIERDVCEAHSDVHGKRTDD